MSASARPDEAVLPGRAARAAQRAGRGIRLLCGEATVAAVAFAALCVVVLSVAPQLAEPDDHAYQASIVGITMGDFLTLSTAQAHAVAREVGDHGVYQTYTASAPIPQWTRLADGRWISEKDPGYPFLAAPFQALGIIRWAPLLFGALACLGLFIGARRWLGRFGGPAAVGLYCSSGAALEFAWRDYMPTFTDASLIAAGSGLLLWAVLAAEASSERRTWAGLAGFVAIEIATFVRYTNIVVLGCAVVAVIVAWRLRAARLPLRTLCWWLASVAVFGAGVAIFDDLVYGGPLTTGYAPGEVLFDASLIGTNLRIMPAHLMRAMPMLVLGLLALAWIIVRWLVLRRDDGQAGAVASRDLGVGLALAASWFAVWALYSEYWWTATTNNNTLQEVRFYVPAIGAISLLGAWLVTRIPGRVWRPGLTSAAVITAVFGLGVWSFHAMVASVPYVR
jgi:hypothetical protein